jgi:hypothetical protein
MTGGCLAALGPKEGEGRRWGGGVGAQVGRGGGGAGWGERYEG